VRISVSNGSKLIYTKNIIRLNPEHAKNGFGRMVAVDGELLASLREQFEAR